LLNGETYKTPNSISENSSFVKENIRIMIVSKGFFSLTFFEIVLISFQN
jgi:hypothetical protein